MIKIERLTAVIAAVMGLVTYILVPIMVHAQTGNVTFWNKLNGETGGVVLSEIGPNLTPYDPSVDGRTEWPDVIGNVQFIPGIFGNAVTLGNGDYHPSDAVHALMLRDLNTVLNTEHGTITAWFKATDLPEPYQHDEYRIFDGPFGFEAPVNLSYYTSGEDYLKQLVFNVRFGGQNNMALVKPFLRINEWMHVAGVWDRNGIDGTAEKVRLYVDGVKVAATTSGTWGTSFGRNRADIAGGNDLIDNKFAVDNLVIYDYAKTDFSDRFIENPINHTSAAFSPQVVMGFGSESSDDSLELRGVFQLGTSSDGINPLNEDVNLKLGAFSTTIPAGSFVQDGKRGFSFKGSINNVKLKAIIHPLDNVVYVFIVKAKGANLNGTLVPLNVQLTIGNDVGRTNLTKGEAEFRKNVNGE